ncbi:MAG: hypothetical protein KGO81_07470 [Bacteroidota bacterium]|nr:hypothetical protein [Bacteroidota bacterium]
MAKSLKKYILHQQPPLTLQEAAPSYKQLPQPTPIVTGFPYKKFQKIAAKVPFTQKEWASILHLSEKTLQRYSKDNTSFQGIYVDRILQIEQLISLGLQCFSTPSAFYAWLKKDKSVFGQVLNFNSLTTQLGIQETYNQVGRILHNVYS